MAFSSSVKQNKREAASACYAATAISASPPPPLLLLQSTISNFRARSKREVASADNRGSSSSSSLLVSALKIALFFIYSNTSAHPSKWCRIGASTSGSQHPSTDSSRNLGRWPQMRTNSQLQCLTIQN